MRRADLFDRGRRLMPAGGTFGKLKVYVSGDNIKLGTITDPVSNILWKFSDGDTHDSNTQVNHTFSPDNQPNNYATAKLEVILVNLTATGTEMTGITMTGKWTNLNYLKLSVNHELEVIPTFPTWTSLVHFEFQTCDLSEIETHPEWVALEEFWGFAQLGTNGTKLTSLKTWPSWAAIRDMRFNANKITTVDTHPWSTIERLDFFTNDITEFETHPEWVALKRLYVNSNDVALTTINTYDTWINVEDIAININGITSFTAYDTWTKLHTIYANQNNLSTFVIHPENPIKNCFLYTNNLDATTLDAALIALDGNGVSNGTMTYANNPGSADINRSASANTAITNLLGKGWAVVR